MSTNRMRSVLSAVVVGAAAMLGGAGPANAALYQGNWDPLYGGIFPELGWKASALFNVPEPCLAVGNATNVLVSSCAGFNVLSAQVELYDKDAPDTILGTYNLNPNVNVTNFDIAAGQLSGIDTGYFSYFVPSLSIAGGGAYSFYLTLSTAPGRSWSTPSRSGRRPPACRSAVTARSAALRRMLRRACSRPSTPCPSPRPTR